MNAVLFFTDRLNKRPELRILRLTKNCRGDTEIWLALREPLSLQEMLSSVQGVELVSPTEGRNLSPDSQDRPLTVTLKTPELPDEPEWRTCVYCREVIQSATTVFPPLPQDAGVGGPTSAGSDDKPSYGKTESSRWAGHRKDHSAFRRRHDDR